MRGTVEKVQYETWTTQDGQRKKEGVVIYIRGWNFPIRWSVTLRGKKWNPTCGASTGFARLVELGLTTKDDIARGTFDTDKLIGMSFFWSKEFPWDGVDAGITLPTAIDGNPADEASNATPEQRIVEALRSHPDGVEINQMPTILVQNKLDDLVEPWFNGLKDRVSALPDVENTNGRLKLRVRA